MRQTLAASGYAGNFDNPRPAPPAEHLAKDAFDAQELANDRRYTNNMGKKVRNVMKRRLMSG